MLLQIIISGILTVIAFLPLPAENVKILFLVPMSTTSEKHFFDPLIGQLAVEGHEVTVVTNTPTLANQQHPNISEIVPLEVEDVFGNLSNVATSKINKWSLVFLDMTVFLGALEKIYTNAEFQATLKQQYDLMFMNSYFSHAFYGIVHMQQCPFILLHSFPASNSFFKDLGYHMPWSHVPYPLLEHTSHMNFPERVINFLVDWAVYFHTEYFEVPLLENVYRKYLGEHVHLPSAKEIHKNVSLVMMNTHFTSTSHRPLMPDVVEIGCLHCRNATKLPPELEEFVGKSAAPQGFIFISFGTILKGVSLPADIRQKFVTVFSKLKERVLWKWESEEMEDCPKNVMLKKWLPQQDILGHPNLRVFISHGGLLSTQQSIFHGVPMVLFPFYFDQITNAKNAAEQGIGLHLDVWNFTEEQLEHAIHTILNQQDFRDRAQLFSQLNKEQMNSPLERAMFWTNHVLKFDGAPHLRSSARDLNPLQLHSFDVMLFLVMVTISGVLVTVLLCRKTVNFIRSRSSKEKLS